MKEVVEALKQQLRVLCLRAMKIYEFVLKELDASMTENLRKNDNLREKTNPVKKTD